MKNKNCDKVIPVKKEQLFSEQAFIQHCIFDYHHSQKLDEINATFLRAAEADRFLEPLLQVEEESVQDDGSKKRRLVNYYSPHQIFIITQLYNNKVDSNGKLVSKHSFDVRYPNRETGRAITWGWQGFTFEIDYYRPARNETNIFAFCKNFHNFLRLLHSLENSRYNTFNPNKERHFNDAPSLHFDYSSLKNNRDILEEYRLSVEKLRILLKNVAYVATEIDPLVYWYCYIHRHPQYRKDFFKGTAMLAQELYIICDLLTDVVEAITGNKEPSLFDLLYGERNIYPYLIPRTEYVHGTDVKSMWAAIKKFRDWIKQDNNKNFVEDNTLTILDNFEKELKEYEDKYGARSFISNGVRKVEVEENIKIEDLDLKARQYIDQVIHQAKTELAESKRQFLSLWSDELEEKIKNKEITLEQAKKEDYDLFVKQEIFDAIEQRLSSLKRELRTIFDTVQKRIAQKANEAWDTVHNFSNYFWFKRKDELNKLSREEYMKLYDAEYQKAYKEAQYWSKKSDEFGEIEYIMDLLFCSMCRKNPVPVKDVGRQQSVEKPLCDSCLYELNKNFLNMSEEEWISTKEGEWTCQWCGGRTLYKFAHNNVASLWTLGKIPIKVELVYGKLILEAKCTKCGQVNQKEVDWGWNP